MRVEEYIKQLLYRYDCVIVPDFGAFVIQKYSSTYQSDSHKFTPPFRKVTFNKAIRNHDGLLAETIAKAESMDFESAKQKIKRFSSDFESALKLDKRLEISELGVFYLNDDKLSFEPNQAINFFMESFGLDDFKVDRVSVSEEVSDLETKEEEKLKVLKPEHSSKEESNSKPYLKYAAIGIITLGSIAFAGLYRYNTYVISYNDSESQKAESLLQEKIQSAEFNYTLTELPFQTTKLETLQPKYHVIAGAFRVEANAHRKVDLLRKKGYDASLLGKNSYGLHQVAFASFKTRARAMAQLRKIKALGNPDAWLFVKQL